MNAASWLWVIGASCLAAELFFRLPIERIVSRMAACGTRAARVVSSRRISDRWKERIMPAYARRMALHTLALTACFAALAALVALVLLAADMTAPEAGRLLTSTTGIVASFLVASAYYMVRQRLART